MALLEALTVNLVASTSKTLAKIWLKDDGLVKPAEGVIETLKKKVRRWTGNAGDAKAFPGS